MTLNEILEQGKRHVVFNDGYEADFRKGGSGNLIFYNQTQNGEPINKGNVVVQPADADRFAKDHQGIKGTTPSDWELKQQAPATAEEDVFEDLFDDGMTETGEQDTNTEGKVEAEPAVENEPEVQEFSFKTTQQKEPEIVEPAPISQPEPVPQSVPEPVPVPEPEIEAEEPATGKDIISKGTMIIGDIKSNVDIEIMGEITGNVTSKKNVTVANSSNIKGNIVATEGCTIHGLVKGNVETKGDIYAKGVIVGDVSSKPEANMVFDGVNIKGNITGGKIQYNDSSVIMGDTDATDVYIGGSVDGNITATNSIMLDTNAVVLGNIKASKVEVKNGAILQGTIQQNGTVDFKKRFEKIKQLSESNVVAQKGKEGSATQH